MSIANKNMFALLNDSDDEGEEGAAPAATKPQAAKAEPKKALTENKPRPEDNKKKVPTKAKDEETPAYGTGDRGGRGGGGGGGGRAGGRGGARPAREGKREFDRHSGTGRSNDMKRGGGGKYNWGTEGGDDGAIGEENGKEESEEAIKRREERELEEKQMTLEEYQAKVAKENEGKGLAAKESRKADNKIDGVALERPEDDAGYTGSKGKFRTKAKKESKGIDTAFLGFQSAPHEVPESGKGKSRKGDKGGGRGGYGGRGGSGGGGRGGKKSSGPDANINFSDDASFPKLG